MELTDYITNVPDFPKEGIQFKDITPLVADADAFHLAIDKMCEVSASVGQIDKIICADARGFIFGAGMSMIMNKGMILARKPNKLPRPGDSVTYNLEYGTNTLIVSQDAIKPGEKILVIDDLLATGGSVKALTELVQHAQATVVGYTFLIELIDLKARQELEKIAPVFSIIQYEGE